MDLGIVIVNWNVRPLLAACLDSVYLDLAQSASQLKAAVCVVDNGSTDGSAAMLRAQFPRTLLIEADNIGMGAGNNRGLRLLADRYQPFALLVLNPDTVVRPGALRGAGGFFARSPAGRRGRAQAAQPGRQPAARRLSLSGAGPGAVRSLSAAGTAGPAGGFAGQWALPRRGLPGRHAVPGRPHARRGLRRARRSHGRLRPV